jgi:peptide/nickel transport system substrate-binding protein
VSIRTRKLDAARLQLDDLRNHVVDEFLAGHIDRRGLLRHGTAYGISATMLAGFAGLAPSRALAAEAGGATIRVATLTPASTNPLLVEDTGGIPLLQQAGEYLVFDDPDLHLQPALATSWSANKDGTVWTFKIRKGVKFHSGKILTADDVVYSISQLSDPKLGSNALSTFKGVLDSSGVVKVDDYTVAFHLNFANGNFPYLVSSDNYNAIIRPSGSDPTTYVKNFDGTGPFKFESYSPGQGANFVRNPDYWGGVVLPARVEFSFFSNLQAQVLALQGQQVDMIQQISLQGSQGLFNNPDVTILKNRATAHREVHMRNDKPPFTDKRVRQAMALTLNRPGIIRGLLGGLADLGNDSPFSPLYPSTDKSVPQRAMDMARAKHLMAEAGVKPGTEVTLITEELQEIPDYAVVIQNAAQEIGLKIKLQIETSAAYYGAATFGNSNWLDSTMGITDFGHRGVPNVYLTAILTSGGVWNAAHFQNKTYDGLVSDYVGSVDLKSQRAAAGKIEKLLLDETPIILSYFYNYLAATRANVKGVVVTGMAQVFLQHATIS